MKQPRILNPILLATIAFSFVPACSDDGVDDGGLGVGGAVTGAGGALTDSGGTASSIGGLAEGAGGTTVTSGGAAAAGGEPATTGGADTGAGGDDSGVGGDDSGAGGDDSGAGGDDSGAGGDDSGAGGDDGTGGEEDPGDTWETFGESFFADFCVSCHNDDGTGVATRDYYDLDVIKAEIVAITCGVAKSDADRDARGCTDAEPKANQFPPGNGAKPSDDERDQLLDWVDAGMP